MTGAGWLGRVQSLLGVVPLGTYLIFHIWQTWGALEGRSEWVVRMDYLSSRHLEVALLLIPMLAHAMLGIRRMVSRPRPPNGPLGGPPMQRVQAVTGLIILFFMGYHLRQAWLWQSGPHVSPGASYDVLWRALGHPMDVAVYAVGVSAVCLHFGHGLSRLPFTWGLTPSQTRVKMVRLAASLFALALWFASLHGLGHFVAGEALFSPGAAARPTP